MTIRAAIISDLSTVFSVTQETIRAVYPHYYPAGAVEFFADHHCAENIARDIENDFVYLCFDDAQNTVGTVTVRGNELCRLFVPPQQQGHGHGRALLDFAEKFDQVVLDASLPAKSIYLKRGYSVTESHILSVKYGDFLCYDVMQKEINDKTFVKRL